MDDELLMSKVCKMFYYQQLSKVEIAEKLRISRFKVARLLKKAQEVGIVKIQIVNPRSDMFPLEERLE
ncbi:MAG TPA: sugar-binding transcriptional regulator, partial [Tepidanaerobacteraceae bacterium]|nr:sugar-binding transcriptional regulator [Tepidanaerobacteraceae bacterium]